MKLAYITVLSLFISLFNSGCASKKPVFDPTISLPSGFLDGLVIGQTSKDYVKEQLGTPFRIQLGTADRELLTYQLVRMEEKGRRKYLFFGKRKAKPATDYFHILFAQDVLIRHWRDDYVLVPKEDLNYRLPQSAFSPEVN